MRHFTVSQLQGTALPFLMMPKAPCVVYCVLLDRMCLSLQQSSDVTFPTADGVSQPQGTQWTTSYYIPKTEDPPFLSPALNASFLSLEIQASSSEK